jgi:predicted transcriptional regulator
MYILYKVVGQNKGPYSVILKDVMSCPIITIDRNASVKDAISLMRNKPISRLLVIFTLRLFYLIFSLGQKPCFPASTET